MSTERSCQRRIATSRFANAERRWIAVKAFLFSAFALVMPLLLACPSASLPPEPDPVLALVAYRDALVAGRPREALSWIHPDAREGLDERGFEDLYRRHREALVAQADELLRRARERPPAQRARVGTSRGDVVLDRGEDGWRLLGPVGIAP